MPPSHGSVDHRAYDALVPPSARRRLYVNLIHHGREVCRASQPRCGECVLISFCARGRQAALHPLPMLTGAIALPVHYVAIHERLNGQEPRLLGIVRALSLQPPKRVSYPRGATVATRHASQIPDRATSQCVTHPGIRGVSCGVRSDQTLAPQIRLATSKNNADSAAAIIVPEGGHETTPDRLRGDELASDTWGHTMQDEPPLTPYPAGAQGLPSRAAPSLRGEN